jgi:disulfide bond formation protein DsbB
MILSEAALVVALVSFVALAGAWGLEIFGHYPPCPLCLEERIPYYAAVPGGLAAVILANTSPRIAALILAVVCLALLYNAGLGIYHAGAEWHFWPGPSTCSAGSEALKPIGNLSQSLQHNRPVHCDEAALRVFGLSLAAYSAAISAALAALGGYALWRSGFGRGYSYNL